jgi:hypothetical protein
MRTGREQGRAADCARNVAAQCGGMDTLSSYLGGTGCLSIRRLFKYVTSGIEPAVLQRPD